MDGIREQTALDECCTMITLLTPLIFVIQDLVREKSSVKVRYETQERRRVCVYILGYLFLGYAVVWSFTYAELVLLGWVCLYVLTVSCR